MSSSRIRIEDELRAAGLTSTPAQRQRLDTYLTRLERWNRAMNLTSLQGAQIIQRLIVEPLWVFEQLQPSGRYVDIGSGNGSPALPWLARGAFDRALLIEARKKRAVFLRQACRAMGLSRWEVHGGRLSELVGGAPADEVPPDWITVQGVKPGPQLWSEVNRMRAGQTRIVWFTGESTVAPEAPNEALALPGSTRRALIFSNAGP